MRSLGHLSTACKYLATFALVAFFGCDPQPALLTPTIEVQFAAQSDRGCQPLSTADISASFDRIVVQLDRGDGFETHSVLNSPAQSNSDNLVTGVPIDSQRLRAVACDGEQPRWSAESAVTIEEDVKTRVQLRFGAPGQSNCFQFKASDTDRQFVSDRPSFLPASVVIPDTERLLVIGGAQNFDGELYTGDATAGWDVVGLDEFVYYKGIDRSANQASRPIDRARIGAVAAVTTLGGRAGALVIGGAEAVNRRNNYQWGPFEPGQLSPNETFTPTCKPNDTPIFIDFGTGQWHPVDSTAQLANRFLAGSATQGNTTVIAGGLECQDGQYRPSRRVEVIVDGRVRTHLLDTEMIGPTVTPIGPNRYLVWGFGVGAGNPGHLLTVGNQISSESFTPTQQMNLPLCDKPYACSNTACETAYHAATRINDRSADGQGGVAQVIISGGIVGQGNDNGQSLNLTPAFNAQAQAPGNLFVLAIGERGRDFTPICFDGRPSPSPARAFHSSTRVGDEVIIAGGWVVGEDETFQACSPDASAMNSNACGIGDTCVGYRCYLGQPGPGSFFESNAWYSLSALLQPGAANGPFLAIGGHGRLARGRFGHSANATRGGAVVISGGSQKNTISREAEYYLRNLKPNPCETEQLASDGAE